MIDVRVISAVGDVAGVKFNAVKLDEDGKCIFLSDCIVKFYAGEFYLESTGKKVHAVNFSWERDKK